MVVADRGDEDLHRQNGQDGDEQDGRGDDPGLDLVPVCGRTELFDGGQLLFLRLVNRPAFFEIFPVEVFRQPCAGCSAAAAGLRSGEVDLSAGAPPRPFDLIRFVPGLDDALALPADGLVERIGLPDHLLRGRDLSPVSLGILPESPVLPHRRPYNCLRVDGLREGDGNRLRRARDKGQALRAPDPLPASVLIEEVGSEPHRTEVAAGKGLQRQCQAAVRFRLLDADFLDLNGTGRNPFAGLPFADHAGICGIRHDALQNRLFLIGSIIPRRRGKFNRKL